MVAAGNTGCRTMDFIREVVSGWRSPVAAVDAGCGEKLT
jgi:hypothetical protein